MIKKSKFAGDLVDRMEAILNKMVELEEKKDSKSKMLLKRMSLEIDKLSEILENLIYVDPDYLNDNNFYIKPTSIEEAIILH